MGQQSITRFRFGHWEADIASGELFKSGHKVHIQRNLSKYWKPCYCALARWLPVMTFEKSYGRAPMSRLTSL